MGERERERRRTSSSYRNYVVDVLLVLFLGGGRKETKDGADSSMCSLKMYFSLSTSLAIGGYDLCLLEKLLLGQGSYLCLKLS